MKKMIALLLCLLGSASLWAQENTVLGTGALSQVGAPKYAIQEINITNPGSYIRPTIDFGAHQITWDYFDMYVTYDGVQIEGVFKSATDLGSFVPAVVGGHGSGATVYTYFSHIDGDGKYVYELYTDNYGSGYAPNVSLNPMISNTIILYTMIDQNGKLIIYYFDHANKNLYTVAPTVNISFGGAAAVAVLYEEPVNLEATAIGYQSLYNNTTGKLNTAIGHQALYNANGDSNLALGYLAGNTLTTGNNNIFIGNKAGNGVTTGSGNVIIGGAGYTSLNTTLNNSVLMADGSGNPRFLIRDNGYMKVGYGTDFAATDFRLDVNGSIRGTNTVHTQRVYARDISLYHPQSTYYHDFIFYLTSPNDFQLRSVVNPNYYATVFSVDKPSASMTFYAPVKGVNAANNNEFVTLGQVRDISSVTDRNLLISNTYPYLQLKANAWSSPSYVQAGVELSSVGVGDYLSFMNPAGKGFNFKRGPVNDMVIAPDGNVGIGITNPQEKLAVNGKIRAREVKVEPNDNWPDYVFEEGYRPMSLEEISAFVKQHKHLPEVPSAKEVAQNGLELGEMNKILLKKIEELTIMLIDQNKKNQEQDELIKKMMAELKQQNSRNSKQNQ